jgi:RimJ/RimL family protein N-acetyltransferase
MTRLADSVLPLGTLKGREQPVLAVDMGLALRPWSRDDIPALVAAYSDPEIQRWNLFSCDSAEAEQMIERWRDRWTAETGADWAITQRSDDLAIGRVWLRFIDLHDGEAEVAYWVAPQARGRGAASSAVSALSSWLFDDLGLHRLQLGHSVHSQYSCRVATNSGLKLEGTRKSALLHADGWHDMHWHAKTVD